MSGQVDYEVRDGVAHVTFNRPEARNGRDVGVGHREHCLRVRRSAQLSEATSTTHCRSGVRQTSDQGTTMALVDFARHQPTGSHM